MEYIKNLFGFQTVHTENGKTTSFSLTELVGNSIFCAGGYFGATGVNVLVSKFKQRG